MSQRNALGVSSVLLEDLDHRGEVIPRDRVIRPEPKGPVQEPGHVPRYGRLKPLPGHPKVGPVLGQPAHGFQGRVLLRNQIPMADWTYTDHEIWHSRRLADLPRPGRELTDEERQQAKAQGLYRDLDAEQPESNPQRQYRLSTRPEPVAGHKNRPALETFSRQSQRMLDELFAKYGY